jgi:dTDP-4-amino-4,6-dideoxygalactose transaminase
MDEVGLGASKEQFVKALRAEGIPDPIYLRPLYEEPIFKEKAGRGGGFPYEYLGDEK